MRAGGGKQKGASFEREVCKSLSLWISNGVSEDVFWRSAMSGGRATVAYGKGKRLAAQAGDISCIHPIGQPFIETFYVECKFYRDLNFAGLLTNKGHLAKFWAESKTQALKYKKLPMMISRQNQYPAIVCLTREGLTATALRLQCVLTAPRLNMYAVPLDKFFTAAYRVFKNDPQKHDPK